MKKQLIKEIDSFVNLLEFHQQNKFKINAFRNGARVIRQIEGEIEEKVNDGSIKDIKGLGKGIIGFITEYIDNGFVQEHESFKSETEEGILELFKIKGLGPKKIKLLYDELKICSLNDIEQAALKNELGSIKGFTAKTEEKILEEIKTIRKQEAYFLLFQAEKIYNEVAGALNEIEEIIKFDATGSYKRRCEVHEKLEISLLVYNNEILIEQLAKLYKIKDLEENTSKQILIENYLPKKVIINLHGNESDYILSNFKNSCETNFLNSLGKFPEGNYKSEEEIFTSLERNFISPEMREQEYFDAPENLRTASNLDNNLNGMIHFHTTFSDGLNTLEEMRNSAQEKGFKYVVVCDHSKSAFYANGLRENDIIKQQELIKSLNQEENKIPIFSGIESDILNNGDLDYSDKILKEFDLIVASIHSNFTMSEEDMTNRIIKAVENPYTKILAHPTGRLLLSRNAYKVNMKKVIEACSKNNVVIEINANPRRLDLDWRLIYFAREQGCKFAINPDAHSTTGIDDSRFGVMVGKKGGLQKEEVINYFDLNKFKNYFEIN